MSQTERVFYIGTDDSSIVAIQIDAFYSIKMTWAIHSVGIPRFLMGFTNSMNTCIRPADVLAFEINGQRIGQLKAGCNEVTATITTVGIGSLDFRIGSIPVAPEQ